MTDTPDTEREPFGYEAKGKPLPPDLFSDLSMLDGLEYLAHITLMAAEPFVELVTEPGATPPDIVAEAAVIAGMCMAQQESLRESHARLTALVDELAPGITAADIPDAPVHGDPQPGDEGAEGGDVEPNHEGEEHPHEPDPELDTVADDANAGRASA